MVARLFFGDPVKFGRDCRDCREYVYDESTGKREMSRVSGYTLPMYRPAAADPPCYECGKTVGLKVRHWRQVSDAPWWAYRAFRFWQQCRAVREYPRDPIVRRCAWIFDGVEEAHRSGRSTGVLEVLGLLLRPR